VPDELPDDGLGKLADVDGPDELSTPQACCRT
jgi:hypothetical protein